MDHSSEVLFQPAPAPENPNPRETGLMGFWNKKTLTEKVDVWAELWAANHGCCPCLSYKGFHSENFAKSSLARALEIHTATMILSALLKNIAIVENLEIF